MAPGTHHSGCPMSGGKQHDKGGLFPSMLCLSGLNTMSGLLPPLLLLFGSKRAARRGDPASMGSPHWPNLPSAWLHAHHPRPNRAGLGGRCLCSEPGQVGV